MYTCFDAGCGRSKMFPCWQESLKKKTGFKTTTPAWPFQDVASFIACVRSKFHGGAQKGRSIMGSAKEPPEFRIEDVYATSTTLIMRGLKRNITREMFVSILYFGWMGQQQWMMEKTVAHDVKDFWCRCYILSTWFCHIIPELILLNYSPCIMLYLSAKC